jgi:hypothetical protein
MVTHSNSRRAGLALNMHHLLLRSPAARQPLVIRVRRSALLEDANAALAGVGADIRRPLRVSFISAQGYEEAGIDQGGLTKEFLEEARLHAYQRAAGVCVQQPRKPSKACTLSVAGTWNTVMRQRFCCVLVLICSHWTLSDA